MNQQCTLAALPFASLRKVNAILFFKYLHPLYMGYKICFSAEYNSQGMKFCAEDKGWKSLLLKDIELEGMHQGF